VSSIARTALVICGSAALVLGIVGVFVPVLPTTPLLLLAAACYARSSVRLHDWLLQHPVFGEYIRDYGERRGMKPRAKVVAITALWLGIGISILVVGTFWLQLLLATVAVLVTTHILRLRTLSPGAQTARGR
jgi:uncharacterized protein